MSIDLSKQPDYGALCQKLIEKTLEGKLLWQETADEDTFIAAVKGVQTFEIRASTEKKRNGPLQGSALGFAESKTATLTVRRSDGQVVMEYSTTDPQSPVWELYYVARRIATRLDEKIESSMELLNQL